MVLPFNLALAQKYAPVLMMDRLEPFLPVRIGVSMLEEGEESPSFKRKFHFLNSQIRYVLEYALYYDYDIQHLYDLEHIWVYVGNNGQTVDAEASFHGKYLKSILPDRFNLRDNRVTLYVQPGKHALSPMPELFSLIPDVDRSTMEEAGAAGLDFGDMFTGILETNAYIDRLVCRHLQRHRFRPSLDYMEHDYRDQTDLFVPWEQLFEEIPRRVRQELRLLERQG